MNSSKRFILGLTGGIGTGKSTASEYISSKGFDHVDADAISRSLTEDGSPMLRVLQDTFGPDGEYGCPGKEILLSGEDEPDQDAAHEEKGAEAPDPVLRLDRRALASIVFSDPEKKKKLDQIMHGAIRSIIEQRIEDAEQPVLLDVPLLFESGLEKICDHVILITADMSTRIERVMARDGAEEEEVLARIRNQMDDTEKAALADTVVDNSGDLEHLYRQLDSVIESLPEAASCHSS